MSATRLFAALALATCSSAALAAEKLPAPEYNAADVVAALSDCESQNRPTKADGTCGAPYANDRAVQVRDTWKLVEDGKKSAKPVAVTPVRLTKAAPKGGKSAIAVARDLPAGTINLTTFDLMITFANGSSTLTPQAKANLTEFAKALTSPKGAKLKLAVNGHTNAVGAEVFNKDLSLKRAEAVVAYLVGKGVDASRLVVHGYGFDLLVDPVNPRSAINRRVDTRVISDDGN